MIQLLTQWRAALDAVYPGLFNAVIGAVVVLGVWLLKKFAPNWFAKLPPAVQALPAMVISAVVTALSATSPTLSSFLSQLLAGTLVTGTMAVGAHHVLKESPLPYGNPGKTPSLRPPAAAGLVLLALVGSCAGCASFGAWSQAAAPDVAIVCGLTGDVLSQLEAWASEAGVPVIYLQQVYADACGGAAKEDSGGAKKVGLSASHAAAHAASKLHASFPAGGS